MSGRTPSTGAVIVSYGVSTRALRCAKTLVEAKVAPEQIVIVNNGPDTFASQGRDLVDATVVEAPANIGYAGGLKLGADVLLEARPETEYIWLLNNDLVVHPTALAELLRAAHADPAVGLWGCTVCSDEAYTRVAAVGVQYSKWTTRRRVVLGGVSTERALDWPDEPPLDFIPGSSMFMSRLSYDECGGLSDDYFLYFEELDLAARVQKLGLRVGWCRNALVAHIGGASTGSYRRGRSRPASVAYHSTRSALIYTRRHARLALPSVVASRLLGYAVVRAGRGDFQSARAAVRGCRDGMLDAGPYKGTLR